jgi:genome maintenance exonuclease 1|tara:strand:+ start:2003 stop:2674 length:672 start_codon:yes stop_codon:yes gene_type:complete
MKINRVYDYQDLTRIDGKKRLYATPGGGKVPSVTTILDATSDKTHLIAWRQRVGEEKAKQITKEAAGVGTSMHGFLENYTKGEELPNKTNLVHVQGRKMAEVVIQDGLSKVDEVWGSEVHLYYPDLYAGTTDLVGVHNGVPAIMDFKQTNKPKKEEWVDNYKLQGAAYALAHNHVYKTDIRKIVIMMCSRDLQYQEFVVEGEAFDEWSKGWSDRLMQYLGIQG